MRTLVFCYGTLCDPRLAARIIGHGVASRPASLRGYRRQRWRGRAYPGIWACPDSTVEGQLLRLRHRRDLYRLDCYEGGEYDRRRLPVTTVTGTEMAWVYVPFASDSVAAGDWDLGHFQRTHLRHYLRQARTWRGGTLPDAGP